MNYWGGASECGRCACGMNNSCADPRYECNCDANDDMWREDSGLPLTSHIFLLDSSGLAILAIAASKVTIHWGN